FNPVHQFGQLPHTDSTLFGCPQQAVQHLLTVEFLSPPVFFDDHIRHFVATFVRSEAAFTGKALAALPDRVAFFAFARIDHFVFPVAAEWASHYTNPCFQSASNTVNAIRQKISSRKENEMRI